jgi:hypothetical protein
MRDVARVDVVREAKDLQLQLHSLVPG